MTPYEQEVRAKLKKRNWFVLDDSPDEDKILLIYKEKNKTKLGYIRKPFYHLRGPKVVMTYDGDGETGFWYQSKFWQKALYDNRNILKLFHHDYVHDLKLLNIDKLDLFL